MAAIAAAVVGGSDDGVVDVVGVVDGGSAGLGESNEGEAGADCDEGLDGS
jgi:hypothetical protein